MKRNRRYFLVRCVATVLAAYLAFGSSAYALAPEEILKDPALEARARVLSKELRCMVCQNQSIDDSDAQLAKDLRVLVRERLVAGDSDEEILDFIVARYGEFALLKPRMNAHNAILWGAPVIIVLAGSVWLLMRRRRVTSIGNAAPLNTEEEARLAAILKDWKA
jgi:cytochrome c-type biogenesis protein CcmH